MPSLETIPAEVRLEIYKQYKEVADLVLSLTTRVQLSGDGNYYNAARFRLVSYSERPASLDTGLTGASKTTRQEFIAFICNELDLWLDVDEQSEHFAESFSSLLQFIPVDWRPSVRRLRVCLHSYIPLLRPDLHLGLPGLKSVILPDMSRRFSEIHMHNLPRPFTRTDFEAMNGIELLKGGCIQKFHTTLFPDTYSMDHCYDFSRPRPVDLEQDFYIGRFDLLSKDNKGHLNVEDDAGTRYNFGMVLVRLHRCIELATKANKVQECKVLLPANATLGTIRVSVKWAAEYSLAEHRGMKADAELIAY